MDIKQKGPACRQAGFTFIELLIVIAVLALVMVATFFGSYAQIFKGYDARIKGDLDKIKIAFENYYGDFNHYPATPQTVLNSCRSGGTDLQPYLNAIPCDPVTKTGYLIWVDDPTSPQKYIIYVQLRGQNESKTSTILNDLNITHNYYVSSPSL